MDDLISRKAAIDAIEKMQMPIMRSSSTYDQFVFTGMSLALNIIKELPSAQPEIIRCKDCKHWKQQTNYKGVLLSFGFCESDDMWRSLYGETYEVSHIDTDDDFYCGYGERRIDG